MSNRYHNDLNAARLTAGVVAYAFGLDERAILAASRGNQHLARARQVAMYLAHVSFGMSLARVASAFGRDRSTVAHACHVIEDWREDTSFDIWLERLETSLGILVPLNEIAA
ncbi:MAG: helix-turn-helix domain-containing protein [Pseudomonadota bacterium]